MSASRLPPVTSIRHLSTTERASILDALFEPCTALHTLCVELLHTENFNSYDDVIADVGKQLTHLSQSNLGSDTEWLDKILAAHPRLGEKTVDSVQSQAEQAQLNTGDTSESEQLRALNLSYEQKFPGLIYVVFVNGRSRSVIMDDMKSRIARANIELERTEAIKAMCDIAADRSHKLQLA